MTDELEGKWRFPVLHGSTEFINWRLLSKIRISTSDHALLGLTERSKEVTAAVLGKREESNAKAKRTTVCALDLHPLLRFNALT